MTVSSVNSGLNKGDVRNYDNIINLPPLGSRLKPGDQEPPSEVGAGPSQDVLLPHNKGKETVVQVQIPLH